MMSGHSNGYDCRARLTTRMQPLDSRRYPKVVVIGAGMAGLSATRELRQKGWPKDKVVLLEATERIGGRMRTRRHRSGVLCDLGAGYVHGTIGNPLTDLAREAGVKLKQVCEGNPWITDTLSVVLCGGGERAAEVEVEATNAAFFELMSRVSNMAETCDDCNASAGEAIEGILLEEPFCSLSEREVARLRLRLFTVSLWHGSDLGEMQLRSLEGSGIVLPAGEGVDGDFPGPHCMVEGGVERLVEAVASAQVRECLRLNAPVRRVALTSVIGDISDKDAKEGEIHVSIKKAFSPNGVSGVGGVGVGVGPEEEVEEEDEVVRADAVIMALPLSLMQQGAVEFDPPLRETSRAALLRLRMGYYEKVTMEFKEAFWPTDAPFIGCCPAAPPAGEVSSAFPLAAEAAASNSSRPVPPAPPAATLETPGPAPSGPSLSRVESSPLPAVSNGHPHATTTKAIPSPSGEGRGAAPVKENPANPVVAAAVTEPSESALRVSREAFDALAEANPAIVSPAPIFLENYLWSKGVPVLTAAITGERARVVSAAAAVAAGAAASSAEKKKDCDDWREAHATEVYRRLVKPALVDAFAKKGKEIPEPVSVIVSSWANEPYQRGSYSFFPVGARDDDILSAGQGAAIGLLDAGGTAAEPGSRRLDRVFFAGEATCTGYEGSMHGAYLSGVRAVEDALRAFDVPF